MLKLWLHALRTLQGSTRMSDVPEWQQRIISRVLPYSMTGQDRILATVAAVEYIVEHDIPGAVVECGVWRGGQMMAAALTLNHLQARRPLFLFDTFEGMTAPNEVDRDMEGQAAQSTFAAMSGNAVGKRWCEARLDEVQRNLASTGYPPDQMHYIVGKVEQTLPSSAPEVVAYLRLDTDWYASTLHELQHLFPLVSRLGVIAIDDYGHWEGARKATDEYLMAHSIPALLHRIDYSGRQFIKP
jgi:hypothetical protein